MVVPKEELHSEEHLMEELLLEDLPELVELVSAD